MNFISSAINICINEGCAEDLENLFQHLIRASYPLPSAASAKDSLSNYIDNEGEGFNHNLKCLLIEGAENFYWIKQTHKLRDYFRKNKRYEIKREFTDNLISILNTIAYLNCHKGVIDEEDKDFFIYD